MVSNRPTAVLLHFSDLGSDFVGLFMFRRCRLLVGSGGSQASPCSSFTVLGSSFGWFCSCLGLGAAKIKCLLPYQGLKILGSGSTILVIRPKFESLETCLGLFTQEVSQRENNRNTIMLCCMFGAHLRAPRMKKNILPKREEGCHPQK